MKIVHLSFVVLLLFGISSAYGQDEAQSPASVILRIDGSIEFERPGWIEPQLLQVGALLTPDDLIFPNEATLIVLCPDGRSQRFSSSELLPNDIIYCDSDPSEYIIGSPGSKRLSVQRGGQQDSLIPYLISPRATAVREPNVDLIWNHPISGTHYEITVRENTEIIWQSGDLQASDVAQNTTARLSLPIDLIENVPYTVDICVTFADLRQGCLADAGWAAGVDVAFYYHPNPILDERLSTLTNEFASSEPESLYASAILLSQPVDTLSIATQRVGYYDEAIMYFTTLIEQYPGSAFAQSPELYNQLGELYRSVHLPLSASDAFKHAVDISLDNTETYALGAYGYALTTPSGQPSLLFDRAINAYHSFLTDDAFMTIFGQFCKSIGETCLDLAYCQDDMDFCIAQLLEN